MFQTKKIFEAVVQPFLKIIVIFLTIFLTPYALAKETLIINVSGISGDALLNIQTRLNVEENTYQNHFNETTIKHFYENAPLMIKKALEPYGYFHANITSSLHHHREQWEANFVIDRGPRVYFETITLKITGSGSDNPTILAYVQNFPLKKNQPLAIDRYEKAKEELFQIVNNEGYLNAALTKKEIRIDTEKNTASLTLVMDTGLRYYFGDIIFTQPVYSQAFLQRLTTIKSGEPFSSVKLMQFQQELSSSRYFKSVSVTPEFDPLNPLPQRTIPTTIETTVPAKEQYMIGGGYGTFTGPRLTLGMDLRRVSDAGQHFTTQLKLSSVLSSLTAKYYIPGKNPYTDQYSLGANIQRFYPKNGQSFSETITGAYTQQNNLWHHSISLNALNDRFKKDHTELRNSHLLYPSYNISRIETDNIINPSKGTSLNFTIQGANENVLSTTDFFQMELKAKTIFSPTKNSRTILRADIGYTVVKDLKQLPLTLNFFAGGLDSLRGYPFDSIGPGRYLREGSIEFQHKIHGDWSAAVFYDVGMASNHFNDPLDQGDGVGIIYHSIIGPIKLYAGRAESKKGNPMSIEISIGPDF